MLKLFTTSRLLLCFYNINYLFRFFINLLTLLHFNLMLEWNFFLLLFCSLTFHNLFFNLIIILGHFVLYDLLYALLLCIFNGISIFVWYWEGFLHNLFSSFLLKLFFLLDFQNNFCKLCVLYFFIIFFQNSFTILFYLCILNNFLAFNMPFLTRWIFFS